MLALKCDWSRVSLPRCLVHFIDGSSALRSFSLFESILLTCHQETVSSMDIALVDAPLADDLLRRL